MAGVKGRSGGPRPNSGGKRPGAGRPKAPRRKPAAEVAQQGDVAHAKALDLPCDDPKLYLLRAMNDPGLDEKLRLDAAKALMPFVHGRIGEGGKKNAREQAAKRVGEGKFAPAAPPLKLVR